MDEYTIKDDDDEETTNFEEVLQNLKEALEAQGMIDPESFGSISGVNIAGAHSREEMEERLKEHFGDSKKGKKMIDFIMNDPDHEFDNVVECAEKATDIALEQPFLAGTCIAIGKHALETQSLPPFISDGIEHGLSQMEKSWGKDFEHPPWIGSKENVRALIYGVFQLRVTNMVFKTLMSV